MTSSHSERTAELDQVLDSAVPHPDATEPAASGRRKRRFDIAPLRHRQYRLLFIGQTISIFGDAFYAIALPWLVYQQGGGAAQLGTVVAIYGVCRLGTTPIGGILADRIGAWRVMMCSDLARLVLGIALAVVAGSGRGGIVAVSVLGAFIGLFAGLFTPASLAITPVLLPAEELHAGNALSSAAIDGASLIGPAIAGLAVATLNIGVAFAIDAVTFAVSAGCLAAIGAAIRSRAPVSKPEGDIESIGFWQLVRSSALLRAILLVTTVANLTVGGMIRIGLPALAKTDLDAGSTGYGGLLSSFSAGCLCGGLVIAVLSSLRRPGVAAMLSGLGMGVSVILLPYAGLAGALVALFVAGATSTVTNVLVFTLLQRNTPSHLLGKVMSAVTFCGLGLFPVSVALVGAFVSHYGAVDVFVLTGVLLILAFLTGLTRPALRQQVAGPRPMSSSAG
ncbi:MAG: MFS transporter [Jatrophihabitantaceae bacterium]